MLFGVVWAEDGDNKDEVLGAAAREVGVFVLVVDAWDKVLVETGKEVGACEVRVDEAVVK